MTPVASITIEIMPDGRVVTWTQEKEKLTDEQKRRWGELKKKVKQITTQAELQINT